MSNEPTMSVDDLQGIRKEIADAVSSHRLNLRDVAEVLRIPEQLVCSIVHGGDADDAPIESQCCRAKALLSMIPWVVDVRRHNEQ